MRLLLSLSHRFEVASVWEHRPEELRRTYRTPLPPRPCRLHRLCHYSAGIPVQGRAINPPFHPPVPVELRVPACDASNVRHRLRQHTPRRPSDARTLSLAIIEPVRSFGCWPGTLQLASVPRSSATQCRTGSALLRRRAWAKELLSVHDRACRYLVLPAYPRGTGRDIECSSRTTVQNCVGLTKNSARLCH